MTSISIKISGATEAIETLRPLPPKIKDRTILRMSEVAEAMAARGAARHNRTGALVASLFNRAIPGGREVGHDPRRAPHAVFVHEGTRPHVILPRKGKMLRWSTGGGGFAFAKRVQHPGYRGDPYLYDAATEAVRQFAAIVEASFRESV